MKHWCARAILFLAIIIALDRRCMALLLAPRASAIAGRRRATALTSSNDNNDSRKGNADAKKKFTGQSGGLFDVEGDAPASTRSPYDREMNLASNFQRTLPFQVALLLFSIAFALYVGFTGGITDGSERYFDDEIDDAPWQNIPPPAVIYEAPESSVLI